MTLVLVQNEGLAKEISENVVHLPKKTPSFWGAVLLYLLNLFVFFDCSCNNVSCIANRRYFSPKVLRDIFSSQNPHSHHLHQVQVNPGGTQVILPSLFLAVAFPYAASLPPSIVSAWQPPLQPPEVPWLHFVIPAGHWGTVPASVLAVLVCGYAAGYRRLFMSFPG